MLSLYITAKVAGKPVSISEASIRSDLLFDDADGIDSLPNQAIFDAIQLMGHLDAKKKFVMYPRFISIFLDKQLTNVPVPLDHFPVNALTSKVFSCMVKKERPSEPQPTPSPPHPSEANVEPQSDPSPRPSPTTHIPDSIPESSGGNHGGHSSSDKSLSGNDVEHDTSQEIETKIVMKKKSLKKNRCKRSLYPNRDEISAKAEPSVQAQVVWKDKENVVNEEKEDVQDAFSTECVVSADKGKS
ncbi:hypothetical protein Tco_1538574 [Tanacetum coccineum]